MNEEQGGMPNPLNPTPETSPEPTNNSPLDANPAESTSFDEAITQSSPEPHDLATRNPAPQISTSQTSAPQAQDPLARPMEQAPVVQPETPKKKKTGLIIGIIIALIIAIGCGVAAVIIVMNLNKGDAVAKAIEKIATGNAPGIMAVDGTITLTPNSEDTPISNIQVDLDSQSSTTSLINNSKATVSINFENSNSASFEFDEIYAANGDLYFKLDGLTNALEDYEKAIIEAYYGGGADVDCITDENGETVCDDSAAPVTDCESEDGCDVTEITINNDSDLLNQFAGVIDIVEGIDGQWLRLSTDDIGGVFDAEQEQSDTSCMIKMVGDIKNYSNSIAELYGKNPFINSTTEGVTVASKSGTPVYRVTIDDEKFASFAQELQNTELIDNLFSCMGYSNTSVNVDNVVEEISNLPTFYVEVDKDYNFTRLYFNSDLMDGGMNVTTDLNFSYPTNINVAEPQEYTDFTNIIQELFTSMYALPDSESVEVVE